MADGPGGGEGDEGGEHDASGEVFGISLENRGKRVGGEPKAKRERESTPAADEPGPAEEKGGEWLEVWQRFRIRAAEDAEADEECQDQDDWKPALHGGRLQQTAHPGEGKVDGMVVSG